MPKLSENSEFIFLPAFADGPVRKGGDECEKKRLEVLELANKAAAGVARRSK